jgi:RimJ/RimL family protein N-acetyltransferase
MAHGTSPGRGVASPELRAGVARPDWRREEYDGRERGENRGVELGLGMAGMVSLEPKRLETERLLLRRWRAEDREPFASINDDAKGMEFFPARLTREESDALVDRIEAHFAERGFGAWAAELRGEGEFIGFIGLAVPQFDAHFTPCVEIGWRLARAHWGQGLATEGARAVMHYAFAELGLAEVVSFTVPGNVRSRRVMEKLGMTHDADDDFDHPGVPEGHRLQRHVLYRLRQP